MSNQITPNPSVPSQIVQEVKFPKFVNNLGIIPTSYKDSMSYYETLAWLCKYLEETVIPTVNQNGEAVEELQSLYIELNSYVTHYFDNLDVQEEINNKLDQMVLNGSLQLLLKEQYEDLKTQVNTTLLNFQSDIQNIASGSPAGVYSTVTALENADPDHSKIYVVTATGKWYYYSTSSNEWAEGGTYQSTEIANESITLNKLARNVQEMIIDYGENYFKDPNNNGSLNYNVIQQTNATVTLEDTPDAQTTAINNKAIKVITSAQGGYVRLNQCLKSTNKNITKISISANLYVPTGRARMLIYNATSNQVIAQTGNMQGNGFVAILENITIPALNNIFIAFQGSYASNEFYITDLTMIEGEIASPSYIDYSYHYEVKTPILNKNILIFGDSITDCCNFSINATNNTTTAYSFKNPSNSYVKDGVTINYSMWPAIINDNYGCKEIRNYAKSGAHYREYPNYVDPRENVTYQIELAINDKNNPNGIFNQQSFTPDIIIFALGTNDLDNDTYDSAMAKTIYESDDKTIDVSSTLNNLNLLYFNEAVRYCYLKVKQEWPMAQIYVVLPLQRVSEDTYEIGKDIEKMALRYGAVIIDGYGNSGITPELNVYNGLGEYLKDGLHPNEKGQNLLARLIIKSLFSNYDNFDLMNK